MRRSNFTYPHPNPVVRLSLAVNAMDRLDALAEADDHLEEVPC